jgi:hypothetical protein
MKPELFHQLLLALVVVAAGCSEGTPADGDLTGEAQFALAQVPEAVTCVRITVAGTRSVVRLFAVAPGEPAVLELNGLPLGEGVFSADAFVSSCDAIDSGSVPAWISVPVTATIVAGAVVEVSLVLRRNGRAKVNIGFAEDGPDGGTQPPDGAPAPVCGPVINEVQVSGFGGSLDEFVEIANRCASPFSLAGARLIYRSAVGTTDAVLADLSELVLPSGGYLLLAGSQYTGGATPDGALRVGLAAGGGGMAIRRGDEIFDSVGYGTATNAYVEGSAAPAPPSGSSIARLPDRVDTNDNGADFKIATPTPRAVN